MKDNYYWIILGIALGIAIYLGDKYIFSGFSPIDFETIVCKETNKIVGICAIFLSGIYGKMIFDINFSRRF